MALGCFARWFRRFHRRQGLRFPSALLPLIALGFFYVLKHLLVFGHSTAKIDDRFSGGLGDLMISIVGSFLPLDFVASDLGNSLVASK